jgi:flagellar basal body-associated protein FliL
MADEKKETKEEKAPQVSTEAKAPTEKDAPVKGKGIFLWLILTIVVLAGSVGGLALSMMMGGSVAADPNAVHEKPVAAHKPEKAEKSGGHGGGGGEKEKGEKEKGEKEKGAKVHEPGKPWMFDKLDSVVANLDEPGVTRYVRVSVILEMSPDLDFIEGEVFLDEKKIVLQDWMTTYLAGLSLEDVRGSRNLNRIKREVLDQFNKLLYGSDKPYVEKVLFKEFAVQ